MQNAEKTQTESHATEFQKFTAKYNNSVTIFFGSCRVATIEFSCGFA